ncbi:RNA-directed DNA polymerase, eukaryota, reverse transcriptase zinc-binding domain protein [Tanacetum coccineum]
MNSNLKNYQNPNVVPSQTPIPPVTKPLFASVLHRKKATPAVTPLVIPVRTTSLKDQDFITIEDSSTIILLKVKDVESMGNIYAIYKNAGFLDLSTNNVEDVNKVVKDAEVANSVEDDSIDDLNDLNENLNNLGHDFMDMENLENAFPVQPDTLIKEENFAQHEIQKDKETMWGNFDFDYACSMARGRSGGIISMWDPNTFSKEEIWRDDSFIIVKGRWKNSVGIFSMINVYGPQDPQTKSALWNKLADFMHNHNGKFILFGDLNVVRNEQEKFGSIFSSHKAGHFNAFIDSSGLIDLPIGGCYYTWMNKAGTKLSKLDRFLISNDILEAIPDIHITALDRLWSDHTPILFHVKKSNFSPSPFKLYNSCLTVLMTLLDLLGSIKQWHNNIKINDRNKRLEALNYLKFIDKKIDEGSANENDHENRIKLLQDIDNLDNLEAHGIINQKRRTQSITGIMHDGT